MRARWSFLVCVAIKGTANQTLCGVSHSMLPKKGKKNPQNKRVGLGWGSPGPSYFVLWGVCLYDTVVFRCDLRQGIRQVCLPHFAFLIRENLPAVENTDRVPGEKIRPHWTSTYDTNLTQYVRRRPVGLLHISSPPWRHASESIDHTVWLVGGSATGRFVSSDLLLCDTNVCLKVAQYQGPEQEKNTRVAEGLGNIQTHKTFYHLKTASFRCLYSIKLCCFHQLFISFTLEEGSYVKRFDSGRNTAIWWSKVCIAAASALLLKHR